MSAYIRKIDGVYISVLQNDYNMDDKALRFTLVWPHDVESFQGSMFCLFDMEQPWNIGVCWIDQVFGYSGHHGDRKGVKT
jgi:hypothetical protein